MVDELGFCDQCGEEDHRFIDGRYMVRQEYSDGTVSYDRCWCSCHTS